ncbi:MAG: serine/threonine-protein kinase [Myxococcota bacterium]
MHTYHIHERIGRGGMAEIFLAIQRGLGGFERLVVFKRIAEFARVNDEFVRSFLREARVAATMNHPNIVTTLDVGKDDDGPYLVLEYLSGETLSFVLSHLRDRQRPLPVPLACQIAASVASALDFVHNRTRPDGTPWPVVHRDVSPSNVMLCYDGQVKLLDFGVAKLAEEDPPAGKVVGKPSYLTPEQVFQQPLGPISDIYQLGIVTWEMLSGRRLFSRNTVQAIHQVANEPIVPPSHHEPKVPKELDDLVLWALERDPDKRCPSGAEFASQLQSYIPDLFGTLSGRQLQDFMTRSFPRQHELRQSLERRVREDPAATPASIDVVPSITRSIPSLPVRAAAPVEEPPEPVAGPNVARASLLVAALTAALTFSFGVFVLGPGQRSEGAGSAVVEAEPVESDATPVTVVPTVTAPMPIAVEELAEPSAPPPEPEPEVAAPPAPVEPAPGPTSEEPAQPIERLTDNLDPWGSL